MVPPNLNLAKNWKLRENVPCPSNFHSQFSLAMLAKKASASSSSPGTAAVPGREVLDPNVHCGIQIVFGPVYDSLSPLIYWIYCLSMNLSPIDLVDSASHVISLWDPRPRLPQWLVDKALATSFAPAALNLGLSEKQKRNQEFFRLQPDENVYQFCWNVLSTGRLVR